MIKSNSPSIESIGLENYLSGSVEFHNQQGYEDLKFYKKYRVSHAGIARMFHVSRNTVNKWLALLDKESTHG
jgi:hypothetical protein